MSRRSINHEDTRTDCDSSSLPAQSVPVLIVVGDAQTLGASRKVVRIAGSLEIGRSPDAPTERAWELADDRVSRKHALIELQGDRATIRDLGSRNGTLVDGQVLDDAPVSLLPGSIVCIGTHVAVFRFAIETDLKAIEQDLATPLTPVATTSPSLARKSQILRHLSR